MMQMLLFNGTQSLLQETESEDFLYIYTKTCELREFQLWIQALEFIENGYMVPK